MGVITNMNNVTEQLKQLLEDAESNHENATIPEDVTYWQGRKDGLRVSLSLLLNDHSYVQLIETSVYAYQLRTREPIEVPEKPSTPDACPYCDQTYFHKAGCPRRL